MDVPTWGVGPCHSSMNVLLATINLAACTRNLIIELEVEVEVLKCEEELRCALGQSPLTSRRDVLDAQNTAWAVYLS